MVLLVKFAVKYFFLGHLLKLSDWPTLGMYFIIHLMIVLTSREPHLKCANIILSTFSYDPQVKTVLCLSLLIIWWCLGQSCRQLASLEVAFNNILRCIWRNCHTWILHKLAYLSGVFNRPLRLLDCFSRKICKSKSSLLRYFYLVIIVIYSAHKHQKLYFEEDLIYANCVRFLCLSKSSIRDLDVESMVYTIWCD